MNKLAFLMPAVFLASCASIQRVEYSPNPNRAMNPRQEIASLIQANVSPGCIAEPSFAQELLQVRFVCSNGIGNSVSRLDRIQSVYLEQYQEWYRVVVVHSAGENFTWSSKSLEDVQRLADAFTALSQPPSVEKTPGTSI